MCCNRCSGMEDRESSPMIMDVNRAAKENCNFRKSVWTGKCMQMTLMSIPPRGEIGLEVHEKTDQDDTCGAGQRYCHDGQLSVQT